MNKFIEESKNKRSKNRDISFHYTNEKLVKDLIALLPLCCSDKILDSGSGKNKVWFNNIPDFCEKYECEIEDGNDFFDWRKEMDWIIGNPPFSLGWKFLERASRYAIKGIAFLGNINFFNSLTPRRLQILADAGFHLNKIHVVSDKRWFGRYYFLIFKKNNLGLMTWELKGYE